LQVAEILKPNPALTGGSRILHVPWIDKSEELTTGAGADVKVKPFGPLAVTIMLALGVAVPYTALFIGAR
jgi:hypothetical protein